MHLSAGRNQPEAGIEAALPYGSQLAYLRFSCGGIVALHLVDCNRNHRRVCEWNGWWFSPEYTDREVPSMKQPSTLIANQRHSAFEGFRRSCAGVGLRPIDRRVAFRTGFVRAIRCTHGFGLLPVWPAAVFDIVRV